MKPLIMLVALLSALPSGQSQTQPRFEVAVVKLNPGAGAVRGGCRGIDSRFAPNDPVASVPLGRCVIAGARLSHLLTIAYKTQVGRIQGGPDWVKTGAERWNVEAKAENPETATEQQILTMLQSLLAEKFKVQLRRVMQDVNGYALVLDKDGPKFKAANANSETSYVMTTDTQAGVVTALVIAKNSLVSELAKTLSGANLCLGAPLSPVVDKTGLTGGYDFQVRWERCLGDGSENVRPTLPSSLKDQLGLKLEAVKVPQEFLMIDHAEKALDN